jgi:hypothetical protein
VLLALLDLKGRLAQQDCPELLHLQELLAQQGCKVLQVVQAQLGFKVFLVLLRQWAELEQLVVQEFKELLVLLDCQAVQDQLVQQVVRVLLEKWVREVLRV